MRTIGQYDEDYLRRQKPAYLWLKVLLAFVFGAGSVGVTAWACGWVRTGAHVVSAENVKAQWQFAYDYEEDLRSAASQWCTVKKAEDTAAKAGDSNVLGQRQSQRIALEQNYARIKADYDARLRDAFRAKLVKPGDVPSRAPELTEKLDEIACTQQPS